MLKKKKKVWSQVDDLLSCFAGLKVKTCSTIQHQESCRSPWAEAVNEMGKKRPKMGDLPITQQHLLPSSLLSLGGFSTWVSILNPCLFCVRGFRSSKLFQTGSCSITSLGAVFFWDPTSCFASLSFPPITCVLIAPLSTQTALGHRWQRDWLSSASHASKTLSQTS